MSKERVYYAEAQVKSRKRYSLEGIVLFILAAVDKSH